MPPASASPILTILPHLSATEADLTAFRPYAQWLSKLQHSLALQHTQPTHPFHSDPYTLRSITVQAVDYFGKRMGFVKLRAEVTNSKGEYLPGAVFLRGGSVAMLIILRTNNSTGAEDAYTLLTSQARVPAGSLTFLELPAGMLDDAGSFAGAAASEIEEECGFTVDESELVDLSALAAREEEGGDGASASRSSSSSSEEQLEDGVYPSPGGCDEFMPIFLCRKEVREEDLKEWEGRLTGLREDGEKITLRLVKLGDLWKVASRDAKALSALALYEGLSKAGKI